MVKCKNNIEKGKIMLLALVGITGVGKTYYVNKIVEKLGFSKVKTIRTRQIRFGEQNGKTGLFMTHEELEKLKKQGKIAYDFDVFGGTYAYLKEEIFSKDNMVFEMHYTTIYDWKKIRPDIKTIYIFPKDINIAKEKVLERNLSKEKEIERIAEIEEHYNRMVSDKKLRDMFDYIIYNEYNEQSEEKMLNLVENIMKEAN
jgi:guanylate kinase